MAKLPTPIPIIDTLKTFNRNTESKCPVESLPTFEIDDIDRDYHLSLWFLYVVADNSKATYNSYRREIERLLQWSWRIKGTTTHSLDRDDIADYMKFVMRPPKSWIGTVNVPRFTSKDGIQVPNPNWRPFTFTLKKAEKTVSNKYQISQSSIRAVYTTLSSFYEFLIEEKVREDNPVVLDRTKKANIRSQQTKAPVLRITNLQWDYVIETAEVMAEHEPEAHERTLFIMTALYMMYLRISELVHSDVSRPIMSNFHENEDGWLFHVAGKGKKDRDIALAPDMLKALKRYRKSRGLPPLPSPGEETPLLINHRTAQPLTSTRQVRVIVKECFDRALNTMVEEGMENQATELKHATVHWLRHTGISEDVKIRHRDHVRDDAGHSTLATTDRYIDSVLAEKQHSATHKRLKEQ